MGPNLSSGGTRDERNELKTRKPGLPEWRAQFELNDAHRTPVQSDCRYDIETIQKKLYRNCHRADGIDIDSMSFCQTLGAGTLPFKRSPHNVVSSLLMVLLIVSPGRSLPDRPSVIFYMQHRPAEGPPGSPAPRLRKVG